MNMRFLTLNLVALVALGATLRAAINVDEPAICLVCHDDIEAAFTKSHVHTAFEAGKCSSCHNPHASRHAPLLNDAVSELCLECHQEVDANLKAAHPHAPAAEGNCLACHDPHASDFQFQAKGAPGDLCAGCHASVGTWQARANVHAPFADGECATCHSPHGSNELNLLTERVPALCFECHSNDADFSKAHQGYELSEAKCTTCHDPHSSSEPSLLMPNQHAPFAGNQCTACHKSGSSASTFELTGGIDAVCTRCHSDIKASAQLVHSDHLGHERSCLNCHNAHASPVDQLLSANQQEVCLDCHFRSEEFAGKSKASILTHSAMDCTECHQPHGSNNETYFVRAGSDLCVECHEGAHASSHPIGPDVIDVRTGEAVTCLTCHQLHGANFEPYLPLNPEMQLCIQCHRR